MTIYLDHLETSAIPLPFWGIAILWAFAFGASQFLVRKAKTDSRAQTYIVPGEIRAVNPSLRLTVVQLVFALAVLGFAFFVGGPVWVFSGGGWILTTFITFGANVRGLLHYRALLQRGAAVGSVKLSNNFTAKQMAFQLFGWAIFCFLIGIVLAHLAFFGAALYLSATSFGYLRTSWKKETIVPE
jgi:hypothetical protein